jgi:hypothetical protein
MFTSLTQKIIAATLIALALTTTAHAGLTLQSRNGEAIDALKEDAKDWITQASLESVDCASGERIVESGKDFVAGDTLTQEQKTIAKTSVHILELKWKMYCRSDRTTAAR